MVGATGTMGRLICSVIDDSAEFDLVARLSSADDVDEMLKAEIVVDVTSPTASPAIVDHAITHGKKVLVGTSGWSGARIAGLRERLHDVPAGETAGGVIIVPNFSIGSVVGQALAQVAAQFFDSIEIVETHGQAKVDSPSGTAVRTAELMAAVRGQVTIDSPNVDQPARGMQVAGTPVHSRRMAGIIAQQDVSFGGTGETLSVRHDTYSTASYESGILVGLRAVRTATGVSVGLDSVLSVPEALRRVADASETGSAGRGGDGAVSAGARAPGLGDR